MLPVITCAATLNPCFNVFGVELLIESITVDLECFDDGFATKAKERFTGYFQGSLGRTRSNTNTSSLEHSLDFEEDILEAEVQDNEAIPLSDEEIALDEAASEAMSNGSGSEGEDVDLILSESD
ncbi:hypothetical protein Tco_1250158 [Tanacetum coccineum]